ncbi:MAG: hydroxymethylpyrimidine/phosphomethylpyrimidine kinase [Pseudomonadota bacterium]
MSVILCFSGIDPCGGAGLIADIETFAALGCHTLAIPTSSTAQNFSRVAAVFPHPIEWMEKQWQLLFEDSFLIKQVQVVKLGLIANTEQLKWIAKKLYLLQEKNSHFKLVIDPVMRSGSGQDLTEKIKPENFRTIFDAFEPLWTPNTHEFLALNNSTDLSEKSFFHYAEKMSENALGVLLTGTHAATTEVINKLWWRDSEKLNYLDWTWQRLAHEFHGSGCTLASACAAFLAKGLTVRFACEQAQQWTYQALENGIVLGTGQAQPRRIHF